jgi:hypothetical protein
MTGCVEESAGSMVGAAVSGRSSIVLLGIMVIIQTMVMQ